MVVIAVYLSAEVEPYHCISSVADLNGDGKLDVVVSNARWDAESNAWAGATMWFNQGGGRFTSAPVETGFPAAATDVDGDGDADIVGLNFDALWPSLNQGGMQGGKNGEFRPSNSAAPPRRVSGHVDAGGSVAFGDLNDDGNVDAFAAGCCYVAPPPDTGLEPSISWVWLNTADPRGWLYTVLAPRTLSLPALDNVPIRATALGDLDGDGDLDVFAAIGTPHASGGSYLGNRILLNDGQGNYSDSGQRLGHANSTSVALGDVDGDGDLDALVGTETGLEAWINQGGAQGGRRGVFALGKGIASPKTVAVFLADLNGDGKLEALTGRVERSDLWWMGESMVPGAGQVNIWTNDGRGVFTASGQHFSYPNHHALAIGDFNGDGHLDILSADAGSYNVWWNRGDGTLPAAAGNN